MKDFIPNVGHNQTRQTHIKHGSLLNTGIDVNHENETNVSRTLSLDILCKQNQISKNNEEFKKFLPTYVPNIQSKDVSLCDNSPIKNENNTSHLKENRKTKHLKLKTTLIQNEKKVEID